MEHIKEGNSVSRKKDARYASTLLVLLSANPIRRRTLLISNSNHAYFANVMELLSTRWIPPNLLYPAHGRTNGSLDDLDTGGGKPFFESVHQGMAEFSRRCDMGIPGF
jgi:hypothetical protein